MKSKIRVLIVDDERLARVRVREMLKNDDEIEIAGECASGKEAAARISVDPPDLIFLDIQMPELDGFGLLKKIGIPNMPLTIFVTAYDEYALKAFEYHAVDYVLKPFRRKRFQEALEWAKVQIKKDSGRSAMNRALALLERISEDSQYLRRLLVKSEGRSILLLIENIDWIQSEDNYVLIHEKKRVHVLRETIGNLEKKLNPSKFIRIHRSIIVNLDCVKELQPLFHRNYRVVLHDETKLPISRRYRQHFMDCLRLSDEK